PMPKANRPKLPGPIAATVSAISVSTPPTTIIAVHFNARFIDPPPCSRDPHDQRAGQLRPCPPELDGLVRFNQLAPHVKDAVRSGARTGPLNRRTARPGP